MEELTNWPENKREYREFCKNHSEVPVFLQDWWLDIVCTKGSWNVCLSKNKSNKIIGILPFYHRRYFGFRVILMPDLTPFSGIWLNYPNNLKKETLKTSFEKKVTNELICQLPKTAYFAQRLSVQFTNWLPFYWQAFKQTTHYTYRIEHPIDLDSIFNNFKSNTRNKIKKAKKTIEIIETDNIDLFFKINELTFQRQSKKIPYSLAFIKKLDKTLSKNNCRKILIAKDQKNQFHAGIYLVWDAKTMYNLMLGADTDLRSSGAVQLLLWDGIRLAASKNCTFDFEGSMMQNIEPVFNSFGGKLTPYHKIFKSGNLLFRFFNAIKNL